MPPEMDQPDSSTLTAIWLCNSTHSSAAWLVSGWYMISLNTTTLSAEANTAQSIPSHSPKMKRLDFTGSKSISKKDQEHTHAPGPDRLTLKPHREVRKNNFEPAALVVKGLVAPRISAHGPLD